MKVKLTWQTLAFIFRATTTMSYHSRQRRISPSLPLLTLFLLLQSTLTLAIKFELPAFRFPPPKCIWNAAHPGALVIVTANVGPGENQRVDVEIIDAGPHKNTYLSKKDIKGETRFAITAHSEADVGVCFKNYLDPSMLRSLVYPGLVLMLFRCYWCWSYIKSH